MASSIRTEIGIRDPETCPVARASADTGTRAGQVARTTAAQSGEVIEEFTLDADRSPEMPGIETIFQSDSRTVCRFERDRGRGCPCERIDAHGCPVSDVHAHAGTLFVAFYAPDLETFQTIVRDLRDRVEEVRVRQLTRTEEGPDHEFVFVDRNRLTARQREVLETSYEMGYFDHPRTANADDVADRLGIAPSTFSEHLAAAQHKLLDALLAETDD